MLFTSPAFFSWARWYDTVAPVKSNRAAMSPAGRSPSRRKMQAPFLQNEAARTFHPSGFAAYQRMRVRMTGISSSAILRWVAAVGWPPPPMPSAAVFMAVSGW